MIENKAKIRKEEYRCYYYNIIYKSRANIDGIGYNYFYFYTFWLIKLSSKQRRCKIKK